MEHTIKTQKGQIGISHVVWNGKKQIAVYCHAIQNPCSLCYDLKIARQVSSKPCAKK